ncbi:zinc finger, CCHC-type [Artemisia annua]|uniref:Zinc finger, CCHC-type n=1 Tax=Artemisia annua TaxID=35608 RepID=A0A2U1LRA9_ARTAN|nr:zinc finger, CCHC-type [Artemisia annua]
MLSEVTNNLQQQPHRRGGGNQTRGRGKYISEGHTSDESEGTDNKPRRNGDKAQIDSYKSGKLGHYAYECPSKKMEEVEALLAENDEEPALLMCLIDENYKVRKLGRVIRSKQIRVMRKIACERSRVKVEEVLIRVMRISTKERLCKTIKLAVKDDS